MSGREEMSSRAWHRWFPCYQWVWFPSDRAPAHEEVALSSELLCLSAWLSTPALWKTCFLFSTITILPNRWHFHYCRFLQPPSVDQEVWSGIQATFSHTQLSVRSSASASSGPSILDPNYDVISL